MARHLLSKKTLPAEEEPTVNLTPLIDVVFVILIMFILIAPLLEMENIELADASPTHKNVKPVTQEAGPIVIRVNKDNSITFNKINVSIATLSDVLKEAKRRQPKAVPQLFHDKRAMFGTYQSVKNAVEAAGYEEIELILMPGMSQK